MYEPKECEQRFSEIPVPNSTEEEEYQINLVIRESERSNTVCAWQNRPFDVPASTCTAPWSRNSHLQSTSVHPFDVPSSTSTCTAPWSCQGIRIYSQCLFTPSTCPLRLRPVQLLGQGIRIYNQRLFIFSTCPLRLRPVQLLGQGIRIYKQRLFILSICPLRLRPAQLLQSCYQRLSQT